MGLKTDFYELLRVSTDKVVIGQFWGKNTTYVEPESGSEIRFLDADSYVSFLVKSLIEVDQYLGHGRIIVLGELNRSDKFGDPLSCLGKPYSSEDCKYSQPSWAVEFNRTLGAKLKEVGITFIDPTSQLCSPKGCINLIKGMPIYSDRSHLSVWGSEFLVQQNKEIFAKAFGIHAYY